MKPTAVASNSAFIDHGLVEIFGQDLTARRLKSEGAQAEWLSLFDSAVRAFGQAEARGMFLRAGRAAFYYWMRENAESLGWREVEFRLLPAPARIKRALTDTLQWLVAEGFFKGKLSSIDDAWQIAVTGFEGEGNWLECNSFIGMMQELVSWAGAGKFYPARETECQSAGAECCLFEISKLPVG